MKFSTKIFSLITCTTFLTVCSSDVNSTVRIYDAPWSNIIQSKHDIAIMLREFYAGLEATTKKVTQARITETKTPNSTSYKFSTFVLNKENIQKEQDLFTVQFQKDENGVKGTISSPFFEKSGLIFTGSVKENLNQKSLTASLELQNLPDPETMQNLQSFIEKLS